VLVARVVGEGFSVVLESDLAVGDDLRPLLGLDADTFPVGDLSFRSGRLGCVALNYGVQFGADHPEVPLHRCARELDVSRDSFCVGLNRPGWRRGS
jgi:hypothetical protein